MWRWGADKNTTHSVFQVHHVARQVLRALRKWKILDKVCVVCSLSPIYIEHTAGKSSTQNIYKSSRAFCLSYLYKHKLSLFDFCIINNNLHICFIFLFTILLFDFMLYSPSTYTWKFKNAEEYYFQKTFLPPTTHGGTRETTIYI